MSFTRFGRAGLLAAAMAAPAGAWAQEGAEAPFEMADLTVLDPVYVTDSEGEALKDVPASVTLIPDEDLEAVSAIRAGDVLAAAPGTFLAGLNGPREIVQIRQPLAFDNRTLFLEDGVPLQSPVYYDQSALGYSQLLSSPGGVEVLRGPGTALYGSDALSGIVNVRTRAPDDPLSFGARVRGGEQGLFDLQAEAGIETGDRQDLRATVAVSGEDGFREETAFHRAQGVLRHAFRGERLNIDSGLYITDYETESATAIRPLSQLGARINESGLNPAVDVDDAVEKGALYRLQSRISYDVSERLSLEATPYLRRQESATTAVFQPATTPREEATVDSFGLLPRVRYEAGEATMTAGLDVELTDLDILLFQSRPDTIVFGDLFRQGTQFDYTVDYRSYSPFIQWEQRFGDVTLQLGLRHDSLAYDFDNALTEVPGDARLQVPDREDDFDATSPKAALIWDVTESHSLFARYARGFRVPRASELYELEAGQAEFTLEPETLDSVEIGWRGRYARVTAELVGYWQESENGVITDVQTAAGNISVNAGSKRFAGIEAALAAELGAGLEAQLVFAWQDFVFEERSADGEDPFDGNNLAEAPETLGNLILSWTPPAAEDFTLTGRLRHIGAWPLNDANTVYSDEEYILTLNGEWRISENLVADLRLENVTDEVYAVFADAPVFAPQGRARPGQVRTLSAGLRLRY
ncbi:MAG: TonB-dependent receptor [Alphaproteobacteria bacterium]|nr:TonB-dependent receptor [Alphaproteobacteria bacterium]